MIERAERYVATEDVRPGDRAVIDGHHLDVDAVSLRLDDVVLTGVPVGRTSGATRKTHVTAARSAAVTILADAATLDEIERIVLGALSKDGGAHWAVDVEGGGLSVRVAEVDWNVPLRASAAVASNAMHHPQRTLRDAVAGHQDEAKADD